jgi:hypothetical protein
MRFPLLAAVAIVSGCGDPCVDMIGPSPIVEAAASYEIDVYGSGVPCDGATVASGTPAPDQVQTYPSGGSITFDVGAGTHTIVLTAFDAASVPLGSACAQRDFGAASRVCLTLELIAGPDLSVCGAGPCACSVDQDCAPDRYCAPDSICRVGCRTNDDCSAASDGGQTVLLPLCSAQHQCVACMTAADCARAPDCQGNVLVSFPATGNSCVNGACVYPPPTVQSCAQGCFAGACTGALASLDNVRALQAGTQTPVELGVVLGTASGGGSAPATRDVTVLADTGPPGAAQSLAIGYFLNGNFGTELKTTMSRTGALENGEEQWTGTIPKQPAGTRIYLFLTATGWDGTTVFAPGSNKNYAYSSN